MEKMKSMLDEIFNARLEIVASVTKEEQEKINEAKTKIVIEDTFENATDSEIKKIEELIILQLRICLMKWDTLKRSITRQDLQME